MEPWSLALVGRSRLLLNFVFFFVCLRRRQAFDPSVPAPSVSGRKDMWGGSSRVVALFPGEWDLKGVMATVEEVTRGRPFTNWLYGHRIG